MADGNSDAAQFAPESPSPRDENQLFPAQPQIDRSSVYSTSQMADSAARPQSARLSSAVSHHSTVRPYGEQYQYAESMFNPPPQLVFTPASPDLAAGHTPDAGAGGGMGFDGIGVAQHRDGSADDGSKESDIPDAAFLVREYPWWRWDKRRPRQRWIVGPIVFFGTTGVILTILGAMGLLSPHNNTTTPSMSTSISSTMSAISSTTSGVTATSSSASSASSASSSAPVSATPLATTCPDPSTFAQEVSYLGVAGATSGWSNTYSSTGSAQDCCNHCYASTTTDCAAWIFSPGNEFTPCTVISYTNGSSTDARCPEGFASAIQYNQGGNWTAGYGPCSLEGWAT